MSLGSERIEMIRIALQLRFAPLELVVTDDSHLHATHAGARTGRGHYHVRLVSAAFKDMLLIHRHRAIYDALGGLMATDIHALAIDARAPGEA
ncbi:MAG: cell division protein BolA [Hydrocarboniphaga sp.]|uniref:BolA family protein n=1 Tax=Hydrocarboniphaga sp. TaxID=2033016 RepID=UPI00262E955B|nr:BolA family protein [Hydrocarboniphaga sp.]MDB5969015.1 cell division protein BolA [Hydrocarboniphaga sp.]